MKMALKNRRIRRSSKKMEIKHKIKNHPLHLTRTNHSEDVFEFMFY